MVQSEVVLMVLVELPLSCIIKAAMNGYTIDDMDQWAQDNCQSYRGRIRYQRPGLVLTFEFDDEADATLFKLRWI